MRTVAAFDFDGTITRRDTFVPFLVYAAGRARSARLAVRLTPQLARVAVGRAERDDLKEQVVRVLAGRSQTELAEAGRRYAGGIGRPQMRPEILERIAWHQAQGHEVAIVSASLDLYLTPIAQRLGITTVLCTTLDYDERGTATGNLAGGNCRGPEKLRRLQAHFGADGYELHAYGDSSGDRELLAAAHHPTWVGRGVSAR